MTLKSGIFWLVAAAALAGWGVHVWQENAAADQTREKARVAAAEKRQVEGAAEASLLAVPSQAKEVFRQRLAEWVQPRQGYLLVFDGTERVVALASAAQWKVDCNGRSLEVSILGDTVGGGDTSVGASVSHYLSHNVPDFRVAAAAAAAVMVDVSRQAQGGQ